MTNNIVFNSKRQIYIIVYFITLLYLIYILYLTSDQYLQSCKLKCISNLKYIEQTCEENLKNNINFIKPIIVSSNYLYDLNIIKKRVICPQNGKYNIHNLNNINKNNLKVECSVHGSISSKLPSKLNYYNNLFFESTFKNFYLPSALMLTILIYLKIFKTTKKQIYVIISAILLLIYYRTGLDLDIYYGYKNFNPIADYKIKNVLDEIKQIKNYNSENYVLIFNNIINNFKCCLYCDSFNEFLSKNPEFKNIIENYDSNIVPYVVEQYIYNPYDNHDDQYGIMVRKILSYNIMSMRYLVKIYNTNHGIYKEDSEFLIKSIMKNKSPKNQEEIDIINSARQYIKSI